MEFAKIDKALQEIVLKRNELSKIDYNDPKYDTVEEELHDLEDEFQDEFGDALEEVLQDVHDEFCPDTDVLLPIAYLANSYQINDGNRMEVALGEGVYVEADDFAGKETKLVLVPGPLRIVMNIGKDQQEVVWSADKK